MPLDLTMLALSWIVYEQFVMIVVLLLWRYWMVLLGYLSQAFFAASKALSLGLRITMRKVFLRTNMPLHFMRMLYLRISTGIRQIAYAVRSCLKLQPIILKLTYVSIIVIGGGFAFQKTRILICAFPMPSRISCWQAIHLVGLALKVQHCLGLLRALNC